MHLFLTKKGRGCKLFHSSATESFKHRKNFNNFPCDMTVFNVTLIFRSCSCQTRAAFTSRQQSGICLKERKYGNVPLARCAQSVPRCHSQRDGLILLFCTVNQSFFTHERWPEADSTPSDSTGKSIY